MRLNTYNNQTFHRGRSRFTELVWMFVQSLFVSSFIPGSPHRRILLRLFGARIGKGVVIKPGVKIKFPWRLRIGDHSWIGENVWIDNLDKVIIGTSCCVSQGAYLCTGSHDWSSEEFDLIARPIIIHDQAWICARADIGPGVVVGKGAVLMMGSTASDNLESWATYRGNPATFIGWRKHGSSTVAQTARKAS